MAPSLCHRHCKKAEITPPVHEYTEGVKILIRRPENGVLVGVCLGVWATSPSKVLGLLLHESGSGKAATQQREGHRAGYEEEEESHLPGAGLNCVEGARGAA